MKYIPQNNNIVVEEVIDESSDIIAYSDDQYNKVISGKIIYSKNKEYKIGDIIYFNKRFSQQLNNNKEKFLIINKENILLKEING